MINSIIISNMRKRKFSDKALYKRFAEIIIKFAFNVLESYDRLFDVGKVIDLRYLLKLKLLLFT